MEFVVRAGERQPLVQVLLTEDAGRAVALVERRLAEKNGIEVGDTLRARSADGSRTVPLEVVGIYRDSTPDPSTWTPPHLLPGNALYVPVGAVRRLSPGATDVTEAVFRIGSPEQAERLHAETRRLLGAGAFDFRVNDKAYRDQVRPIQRVAAFAGLIVRVVAVAGALILGLVVMLQIRNRRDELGILLSLGEKKWKLIAQQALEIVAVAALAVGLSGLFTQSLTQSAGQSLLGQEAAEARDRLDSWQPPAPGSTGLDQGIDPDDKPVENADPIDRIDVRLAPADLATVGGVGLGIGLLATAVPAASVLRFSPRTILTKGK